MRQDSGRIEANPCLRCVFAVEGSWSLNEKGLSLQGKQKHKWNEESVTISITKQNKNILQRDHTIKGQEEKLLLADGVKRQEGAVPKDKINYFCILMFQLRRISRFQKQKIFKSRGCAETAAGQYFYCIFFQSILKIQECLGY